MTEPPTPLTVGAFRDRMWDRLAATRAVRYPLPPHGHHPNFVRARDAAQQLLAHPEVAGLRVLVAGPERVLLPLRKLVLEAGMTLYVPHQKKEGWYWRLSDPAGAQLSRMAALGEPRLRPEGAQAAVLACVAADRQGGRVGKGFGWGARGLNLSLPEYTLAHPLMLVDALPCPADSRVRLIGTPGGVTETTSVTGAPAP